MYNIVNEYTQNNIYGFRLKEYSYESLTEIVY